MQILEVRNDHASDDYIINTLTSEYGQVDLIHGQTKSFPVNPESDEEVRAQLATFADVVIVSSKLVSSGELYDTGGIATVTLTSGAQGVAIPRGCRRVIITPGGLLPSVDSFTCDGGNVDGRCIVVEATDVFTINNQSGSPSASRIITDTVAGAMVAGSVRGYRYSSVDSRWHLNV